MIKIHMILKHELWLQPNDHYKSGLMHSYSAVYQPQIVPRRVSSQYCCGLQGDCVAVFQTRS